MKNKFAWVLKYSIWSPTKKKLKDIVGQSPHI